MINEYLPVPVYGLKDLIVGKTPTYVDWDVDPTDGADITDGDISTICTTGTKAIGAGFQFAYIEFDLGGSHHFITGGNGQSSATAGAPYLYLFIYSNGNWERVRSQIGYYSYRGLLSVAGYGSKVRLGFTGSAIATISPSMNQFNVWKVV